MAELPECLRPGWSVCYRTTMGGVPVIHSWGQYGSAGDQPGAPLPGVHRFEFWQEQDYTALKLARSRTRIRSTLWTRRDFRPVRYTAWQQGAPPALDISFRADGFVAAFADGTRVEAPPEEADFLLAANMLPQLAVRIRLAGGPFAAQAFSPETLRAFPYALRREGNDLVSDTGETLSLGSDGLPMRLVLPGGDVVVERVERPPPRWRGRPGAAAAPVYRPPPRDVACVHDVRIPVAGVELGATVALPPPGTPPRAAVVFLAGSGRHDRHGITGEIDLGYHRLLDTLAAGGVCSLRFDKRGAGSTRLGDDLLERGFDDTVRDAAAVLDFAGAHPAMRDLPRFLVGHSQGGLVALELASSGQRGLAGVVLLATAARPIDEVLREQITRQGRELGSSDSWTEWQLHELDLLFDHVRTVPHWTQESVPASVYAKRHLQAWYSQMLARDPLQLARALSCPALVLHGDKDFQVSPADAALLAQAARAGGQRVECEILPGRDHLLMPVRGASQPGDYFDRRRRVGARVVERIRRWILRHAAAPGSEAPHTARDR